jgi:multidrug efflux pump subunit AcrB
VGGDAENSSEAQQGLFTTLPLGYLVMFVITVLMFSSVKNAVAIWLTVPLALIGVTPGFLITGIPFGFMALIGLLSLSGMLIRNGIVLVEEIEQQKTQRISTRRSCMPPPRACALSCSPLSPPFWAWRRCCWMFSSRAWPL